MSISSGRSFYIAVGGGIAEYAWCHIKNIIEDNRFNCQLIDKSEDMGMLSIQGPKRYLPRIVSKFTLNIHHDLQP